MRIPPLLAAAALPLLLGGCVVAALPMVAGGMIASRGGRHEAAQAPAPPRPAPTSGAVSDPAKPAASFPLTKLTALPPPSGPPAGGGAAPLAGAAQWDAFVGYALARTAQPDQGQARSVLLETAPLLSGARFRACGAGAPAVIIDLDPQHRLFAADSAAAPAPELRADLQRLRDAGVGVLWLSEKPADQAEAVAAALRRSGLDAAGRDDLVLARSPGERKQVLRARAGLERCVIAIAGDEDSDFDEFFDYLRDPTSAAAYRAKLGAGWFLVPPPLG